jgi:N12 class adenine-specific DNA methylase
VFTDPQTAAGEPVRLIPAPEYLSGNVRAKLDAAEAAADRDAATVEGRRRWDANIAALREVIPPDLNPSEIDARLGASWIDADTVQQFLRELLDDPTVAVEHPGGSTWAVKGGRHSVLSTSTYGTERSSAIELVGSLLEQRQIRIYDHFPDGSRIPNLTETVAAQEKAGEISEKFSDWIWSDPDRATRLARHHNDTFNAIVLRSYDGTQMQLPGLTVTFAPREHQTAAVARIVSEPSVLLAHEVGAGKTAEMVIGAMELRRLGMAQKPAVVVPNHMLEQFSREWMQLYPQARILAASIDDLSRDKRRMLVARIATGDWDAVILSRSAFERVPLSVHEQQRYLDTQLTEMRRQLDNAKGGHGLTVKRLEGALARAEERLKKLTDGVKDPGISFEETGIDYLMVDITDRTKSRTRRSSCVTSGTSRGCLPTMAGTFVTSGRRRVCGTTSGDRRPAGSGSSEAAGGRGRSWAPTVANTARPTGFCVNTTGPGRSGPTRICWSTICVGCDARACRSSGWDYAIWNATWACWVPRSGYRWGNRGGKANARTARRRCRSRRRV